MLANAAGENIPDAEAKALVSACEAKVRIDSETPGCATYDAKGNTFRFDLKTAKSASVGSTRSRLTSSPARTWSTPRRWM